MTEITAENINKLITNDVSQFMKQVMKKKERSQKQKENDAKLKDRLKSYHEQKRQAKSQNVMSVYDNTNEPIIEIQEAKEVQEIQEVQTAQEIAFKHIEDSFKQIQEMKSSVIDDNIDDDIKPTIINITDIVIDNENVEVLKSKRGRPKKHQHPGPSEIIATI
jgi:hypothetical protein